MIIIQNLSKSFGDKTILHDFSYQFPFNTNVALVGANGIGKTTFLNMVCGLEESDGGKIIIPKDCKLAYLPQQPNPLPLPTILQECLEGHKILCDLQEKRDQALAALQTSYDTQTFEAYEKLEKMFSDQGGYALEADAKGILVGLGFETSQFEQNPLELSGGWRMRLELAKLLVNDPNFLILDEPTNHLDLPSLIWLEQYLKTFRGTLLFVSHDRDFLNNLSEVTLHMTQGNLKVYNGDFDAFLQQKAERSEQIARERKTLQRQQNHLQAFVDRFRYKATKAKQAQSRLKMIERLKQVESRLEQEENSEKKVHFNLLVEKQSSRIVLTLEDIVLGYEKPLLRHKLNLKILRGQKIAVIGTNGIGKTTLLKSIIGEIPLLDGTCTFGQNVSVGYYAQNQLEMLDLEKTPLENLLSLAPNTSRQQALSIFGSLLISQEDLKKKTSVLSGGEKSKVALASLLAQRHNFLILDEPTNHLDMSSTEVLGEALKSYNGTVFVVSHNRAFINDFTTHLFQMDRNLPAQLIDRNGAE